MLFLVVGQQFTPVLNQMCPALKTHLKHSLSKSAFQMQMKFLSNKGRSQDIFTVSCGVFRYVLPAALRQPHQHSEAVWKYERDLKEQHISMPTRPEDLAFN